MYNDFAQWCKIKIPYVFMNFEDAIIQWNWMKEEKCGIELKWGRVQERARNEKDREKKTVGDRYY